VLCPMPDTPGIGDDLVMTDWEREVGRLVEHGRDREAAALALHHLSGQLDEPTPCTEPDMFRPPAEPPADASPTEQLVAFTGRRVERNSQ
jgi:hypothetical protein